MRSPLERRAFCHALTGALWLILSAARGSVVVVAGDDEWISAKIKRQAVNSTNLKSVGYHRDLHVLEIEFHSGSVYRYRNVPLNAYVALMRAESKGRHFIRQIRGRFEFKQTCTALR